MADQYYPPKTKVYTNAIVRVYRPILTEEERARRMKAIHDAAVNVLKDLYETERKKKICG
jgi:hypothetical protein